MCRVHSRQKSDVGRRVPSRKTRPTKRLALNSTKLLFISGLSRKSQNSDDDCNCSGGRGTSKRDARPWLVRHRLPRGDGSVRGSLVDAVRVFHEEQVSRPSSAKLTA